MVKIAHASIDENRKTVGGLAGDQTGKEVCIRSWYSKPWNVVIRLKSLDMQQKVADCMIRAANNVRIGYDQQDRNSLLRYARNVGYDPYKVTTPCETDCSALVTLACIYAGIPESALVVNGNSATTSTIRKRLEATGKVEVFTDKDYTAMTKNLLVGDILLSEGHHVAVVVEIERSGMTEKKTGNPYPEPVKNIRLNSKGNDVRWVQWMLNDKGHYGLIIDGIFGEKSLAALKDFQMKNNLVCDGVCGPLTRAMLKQ